MGLMAGDADLLGATRDSFMSLIRDRRTGRPRDGVVRGIIGSEHLVCSRIAAFAA